MCRQVVEDILNTAEQIAIAEGGPAGEVTLLRLLKVTNELQTAQKLHKMRE